MAVQLIAYLSFRDNAREAMEFYRSVFGGTLEVSTFADFHASEEVAEQDKVMHAALTTPYGLTLFGSDTPNAMELTAGSSISLALTGDPEDDAVLRGYFDGLAAAGTVTMPLDVAPWGDTFGMVTDTFGTAWMVSIAQPTG